MFRASGVSELRHLGRRDSLNPSPGADLKTPLSLVAVHGLGFKLSV